METLETLSIHDRIELMKLACDLAVTQDDDAIATYRELRDAVLEEPAGVYESDPDFDPRIPPKPENEC